MVVVRLAKRMNSKLLHHLSACMRFRADHPGRVLARGNHVSCGRTEKTCLSFLKEG